jgi:tripartite-type tricarboxylate transporter receptor subunit TctC
MITHFTFGVMTMALSLSSVTIVSAQEYPHKVIRVIVPSPPGSSGDALMRTLRQPLTDRFRQPFIITNRAADGGTTATLTIVEESPDGYNWLFTSVNHVANVALYSKLLYNVERDFAAISLVGNVPLVLVAHPATGFKTARDLIEAAKAKPDGLNFGSVGIGTGEHLAMEMLKRTAGIALTHRPHRETSSALAGMVERQSHVTFANIPQALSLIKDGRLNPLAVSRVARSPLLPNTPTLQEIGLLKSDLQNWFGLLARSGVPRHILRRISSEIVRLVREPEMAASLAAQGMETIGSSPEEFDRVIRRDLEHLPRLIREAGNKAK